MSRADSGVRRTKRLNLVGDVQEYWGSYVGEVANTIWDLIYL